MAEKKKAKVTAVSSSTTSKSAKEAAYGKREYDYVEEIRDDYNSMWRDIQINIIL